jgi:hypothetical protein
MTWLLEAFPLAGLSEHLVTQWHLCLLTSTRKLVQLYMIFLVPLCMI